MPPRLSLELIANVIAFSDTKTLAIWLRVSRACFDLAGKRLYSHVTIDQNVGIERFLLGAIDHHTPNASESSGADSKIETSTRSDSHRGGEESDSQRVGSGSDEIDVEEALPVPGGFKRQLLRYIRVVTMDRHDCSELSNLSACADGLRLAIYVERVILTAKTNLIRFWSSPNLTAGSPGCEGPCVLEGLGARAATVHDYMAFFYRLDSALFEMLGRLSRVTLVIPPTDEFLFSTGYLHHVRAATSHVESLRLIVGATNDELAAHDEGLIGWHLLIDYLVRFIWLHPAPLDIFIFRHHPDDHFKSSTFHAELIDHIEDFRTYHWIPRHGNDERSQWQPKLGKIGGLREYYLDNPDLRAELDADWSRVFEEQLAQELETPEDLSEQGGVQGDAQ